MPPNEIEKLLPFDDERLIGRQDGLSFRDDLDPASTE